MFSENFSLEMKERHPQSFRNEFRIKDGQNPAEYVWGRILKAFCGPVLQSSAVVKVLSQTLPDVLQSHCILKNPKGTIRKKKKKKADSYKCICNVLFYILNKTQKADKLQKKRLD